MAKYFGVPFAVSGDKTTIPDAIQVDGSVSYTVGFGPDYSQDPAIDPETALEVPRHGFNELAFDITSAIQVLQQWGVSNWITTSDNDGTPYPYTQYAYALFNDGVNGVQIYQSLQNSNTDQPVTAGVLSSKWRLLDRVSQQAVIYDTVKFQSGVTNGNAVYWNAAGPYYSQAIANGSTPQSIIGFADVTNNRVISFGIVPGLSSLTPGSTYYLSTSSAGGITVTALTANNRVQVGVARDATTLLLNIQSQIPISILPISTEIDYFGTDGVQPGFLQCDGSPVSRITYAALFAKIGTSQGPGDGSTTFNLPDSRRLSAVGMGGAQSSGPGTTIGVASSFTAQLQAVPTNALPSHAHGVTDPSHIHSAVDTGHAHEIVTSTIIPAPGLGPLAQPPGIEVAYADPTFTTIGQAAIVVAVAYTGISINVNGAGATSLNTYGPSYIVDKQIFTGVF